MSTIIYSPYPLFVDSDGTPLEDGYIYIGTASQNPETNPLSVYWDSGLTVAAGQPIRTLGGYPSRGGTPAQMFVSEADYSMLVRNKNAETVFTIASAARFFQQLESGDITPTIQEYSTPGNNGTWASPSGKTMVMFELWGGGGGGGGGGRYTSQAVKGGGGGGGGGKITRILPIANAPSGEIYIGYGGSGGAGSSGEGDGSDGTDGENTSFPYASPVFVAVGGMKGFGGGTTDQAGGRGGGSGGYDYSAEKPGGERGAAGDATQTGLNAQDGGGSGGPAAEVNPLSGGKSCNGGAGGGGGGYITSGGTHKDGGAGGAIAETGLAGGGGTGGTAGGGSGGAGSNPAPNEGKITGSAGGGGGSNNAGNGGAGGNGARGSGGGGGGASWSGTSGSGGNGGSGYARITSW